MNLSQYVHENSQELLDLLLALCVIPAPSNHEEKRAEYCLNWLKTNHAENVYIDEKMNVIYPYAIEKHENMVVFMAHTDTVFPDTEPMPVSQHDGLICCPGVGDDTANLAVLLLLMKYFALYKPATEYGVLFVANAGEEGLGDLKGSRAIMAKYGTRVASFVSFDGYYTGICDKGVGSSRFHVICRTKGGHSFADFGRPSAIQYLAGMITDFYHYVPPKEEGSKTTFNVGLIEGGTSVNSIAQEASMLYEYRSDSMSGLTNAKSFFDGILAKYQKIPDLRIEIQQVGDRPCSSKVHDPDRQLSMERAVLHSIQRHAGLSVPVESGSTDSNIPLSMGIPSLTFGVCIGGGAHTREEWIKADSLHTGFEIAADTVRFCSGIKEEKI